MRLRAWDLTIERGGRRLFAGLDTCGILIVDGDGAIRVAMWDMSPTEIDMLDQPSKDTGKSAPGWRFLKLLGMATHPASGRAKARRY